MTRHFLVLMASLCVLVTPASAAGPKTYQSTGTVEAVTDTTLTILTVKGKEHWEIARDATTKVTGDLKVGSKVTVQYRMTATQIEVKPAK